MGPISSDLESTRRTRSPVFAGRREEWRGRSGQWVYRKCRLLESVAPGRNPCVHRGQIGGFVISRKVAQIGFRQLEHSIRRARPTFLDEHKRAGQLNQALEEIPVGSTTVQKPEIFEDVMSFIESLVVEGVEIAEIPWIESLSRKPRHPCGYDSALVCHPSILPSFRKRGRLNP